MKAPPVKLISSERVEFRGGFGVLVMAVVRGETPIVTFDCTIPITPGHALAMNPEGAREVGRQLIAAADATERETKGIDDE